MAVSVVLVLVFAAISCFLYAVVKAIVNPLRHIPGPTYSRFTTLPLKLAVLGGKRVHHIHALHLQYGPLVRIGPNELSVADPTAFKIIHKSGPAGYPKSPWYYGQSNNTIRAIFDMEDNREHAERRKLLMPGFTKSHLTRDWEPMVKENSRQVVQRMRGDVEETGEVDVDKWWTLYAADTSSEVMFGESFGMIEKGERNQYLRDLEAMLVVAGVGYELPILPLVGKHLPVPALKQFFGFSATMIGYGQKAIDASKDANASRCNAFATMNAEAGKGEGLADIDIAIEAGNLQVAGLDTTTSTLTYLTWAVVKSPSISKKLAAEVEPLNEVQFNDAHLSTLPYLNAVINETLRLYNAAPSSLPRVVPRGGAILSGHNVPQGTVVGTQAHTIHRLTERWGADANDFRPERWLSDDGALIVPEEVKDAFVPWGGGSRACLGQHLAMMELRIAAAMFAREFGTTLRASDKSTEASMEIENYFVIAPRSHACWFRA